MNWASIRNFGRVKYFSLSYVILFAVPLVAEIVYFVNQHHTEIHISKSITIAFAPTAMHMPTSMKLLYAASLCYAVAIAVYQYRCPSEIKDYEHEEDYVGALEPLYVASFPDRKLEVVLANLADTQKDTKAEILRLQDELCKSDLSRRAEIKERLQASVNAVHPGCVQRFLLKKYKRLLAENRGSIWISGVLYWTGTALMIVFLILKAQKVFTN
jgi:hypothetical protein